MIKVFTDGGSRGNPGPSAAAFVVYKDDEIIYEEGKYLGINTNNFAEYSALLMAVEWLLKNNLTNSVSFYLDSELIVKQINKIYKIKNKNLINIFDKIENILQKYFSKFSFTHVPRVHNKKADSTVNIVLDENK